MNKILIYNLKPNQTEGFSCMPVLHDYKVDEIRIENNTLCITTDDFNHHDYNYSDIVGFCAKKCTIEFVFDDNVECELE